MSTKKHPGPFDCYERAEADEPMFILLARDPSAPAMVEQWAAKRAHLINAKRKPESDRPMIVAAQECADAMRMWYKKHRGA
jgi:hypothetical protein